jgi:hypothetical protein
LADIAGPFSQPLEVDQTNPLADLDFLDLHGDLYWLQPINDRIHARFKPVDDADQIAAGLASLTASAVRLGLTVPECFIHFMENAGLRARVPLSDQHLTVGPLMKVRIPVPERGTPAPGLPEYDVTAGYIVTIIQPPQHLFSFAPQYCYLYLDTTGSHHIFTSRSNWSEFAGDRSCITLTPLEEELGIIALPLDTLNSDDNLLCGFSFEGFLAREYFERWSLILIRICGPGDHDGDVAAVFLSLWHAQRNNVELPSPTARENTFPFPSRLQIQLKTFISYLYTEEGRRSWRSRPSMRSLY